jgi:RNA polymerase-binding transcription factor DksA
MGDTGERRPEDLFAGFPASLAIYRSVRQAVSAIGEASAVVTKSQVAFRRRKGFAYVWRGWLAMASGGSGEEAGTMAPQPHHSSPERPANDPAAASDLTATAARLRQERDDVGARLASMTTDLESLFAASADSNADDEHDPEGQTIAYERSQLTALIEGAQDHLAAIEAAILRVELGTYGTCEVCHRPIPAARLDARPTARTCIQDATPTRG